jgi:hypothetical protein
MHAIARDRLLNLGQQRLGITDEKLANVRAVFEFRLQYLNRDAKQATPELHQTTIERRVAIHGREEAKRAFAANVRRLDRRPVLQNRQQRENSAIGEIGVVEDAARLAHNITNLVFGPLKMGVDPGTAFTLKCGQQSILRSDSFSATRHVRAPKSSQRDNNRKSPQAVKVAI